MVQVLDAHTLAVRRRDRHGADALIAAGAGGAAMVRTGRCEMHVGVSFSTAVVAGAQAEGVDVRVEVVVVVGGLVAGRLGFPAVAAVEDVFDALVGGEFVDLPAPGGGEGAAVEVLEFCCVARFGEAWDGWGRCQWAVV